MPISNKNLGKYKRPDIYIEEINSSVVELPIQDVLINLVPGFSKKGPINKPVQVTNSTDFTKIFGDIDKSLERKGSYFHRTCLKMLESGPIYALNMLSTDDDRDKLKWKTISLAAQFNNGVIKDMPYSRIFNKQDFWKRDAESFLDYTEEAYGAPDNDRLLHITNVGDKTTTTFIYKSAVKGFDVSAEEWYGGSNKVPAYINPKDWISDYMVTVVVVDGDWTNYSTLTKDSKLGKYFTTEGLVKGTVSDFYNEKNVTILAYYDACLIPYFRDLNKRNMYIKTVINNDTDKTGLFCTFNEDVLLDSDNPTGTLDIIGSSLVGSDVNSIEFLSYKESVKEDVTYSIKDLDSAGNTFYNTISTNMPSTYASSRTGKYTNGYFEGIQAPVTGSTLTKITGIKNNAGIYYVYGFGYDTATSTFNPSVFNPNDQQREFATNDVVYFNTSFENIEAYKAYYVTVLSGTDGRAFSLSETINGNKLTFSADYTTTQLSGSTIYAERIMLDYTISTNNFFNVDGTRYTLDSAVTNTVFQPLQLSVSGPNATSVTYAERYDVLYLSKGSNTINVLTGVQSNSTASKPAFNYDMKDNIILGYYKFKTSLKTSGSYPAPALRTVIDMTFSAVSWSQGSSIYLSYNTSVATLLTLSSFTTGADKYLRMSFNTSGSTDNTNYYKLRAYRAFTELEQKLTTGKAVIINETTGAKYSIPAANVTTTDYSLTNNATITIKMNVSSVSDYYTSTNSVVMFYYIDDEFMVKSSGTNTNRFITSSLPENLLIGSGQTSATNAGVIGKYSTLYLDYYNGIINNYDTFYVNNDPTSTKAFLKMWMIGADLYVDFVSDESGVSPVQIDEIATYSNQIVVSSQKSNYKQTVEIDTFDMSLGLDKVYEISIDKTRYSEIIKGNFLEGYDNGAVGERKMVRVIKTIQDPNNTNNKLVQTDGPINVLPVNNGSTVVDYYTTVYPQIDTYVSTYKGISLAPFKISTDSMPNKTESRQSAILEVIGKTTNLAKALANKNKISWRYLVDSFGMGLTAKSKQQLADLCGMKLNCLGFVNMPSVKYFKKSDNPSFTKSDGTLDTEILKMGGDETKSPSFLYSFAEGIGSSCVGYFFPFVQIDDDGTPLDFPPSSYAASTYMKKFLTTQSGIQPWTISAGITNGRVTGIGDVEMDFNDDDLTNLSEMGANPIVKKKDNGFCINSEYTANIFPYSSLSLLHSREVLIELENSMYDMLLRYQWKFNTTEVRAEIKYKADNICKDIQTREGLYDYKNIMDETNNTNYIIDLQMGVLDTGIEIIKGMGIIVNNITILKKGDIQSGGFK